MSDVTSVIDLYDSEVLLLEKVLEQLNQKQGKSVNLEAFRKEGVERLASIGLVADAKVYETTQEGIYAFDFEIKGRNNNQSWDPDKQVFEVTNDILDVLPNSEKGQTIKSKPGEAPQPHKH